MGAVAVTATAGTLTEVTMLDERGHPCGVDDGRRDQLC